MNVFKSAIGVFIAMAVASLITISSVSTSEARDDFFYKSVEGKLRNNLVSKSGTEKVVKGKAPGATKNVRRKGKSEAKSKRKVLTSQRTIRAYSVAGQHVSTKCFPTRLQNVLATVKKRYGRTPIVNSGYRSAKHNRRVGGARSSYHVKCMAADIKVPGVSKYKLARYLRGVSGVGGVGTYACKNFIHVDIGPKRSWHWRCRGKRSRRS